MPFSELAGRSPPRSSATSPPPRRSWRCACSTSTCARAEAVAIEHGGGKAEAYEVDATSGLAEQLAGIDVLVNSAAYRINLDVMEACLEAGVHYMDLGGLYHVTAKQLELSPRFKQRGLLALLGIGSAPGKTNLLAVRARRELGGDPESISVAAAGRDLDPPDGISFPYALRTLLDEITLPPMALINGRPEEMEPLAPGPTLDFGEPIGEGETIFTLHSEVLTFGDSFGADNVTFALSLSPKVLETLRGLADASDERIAEVAASAVPSSPQTVSVHLVIAEGAGKRVSARSVTMPHAEWGLGGGILSTASPAAAAVRLLARGEIKATGALPPEACIDPDAMFAELETRGVRFETTSTTGPSCEGGSAMRAAHAEPPPDAKRGGGADEVGVPTEIKPDEYRVALTAAGVRELVDRDHEVLIQAGAGEGSAIDDDAFVAQGARIVPDAAAVFEEAEMVMKVKEPQPPEVEMLREGQLLFTYLHLAPDPELTKGLQASGATCVAYETVEDHHNRLPLLAPMSEVAGKIAAQAGAFFLEKPFGGRGILLGGVPGVAAANVMVIGGGAVGFNAASIAIGMEADVFVFDVSLDKLRELDVAFGGRASTVYSSTLAVEEMLPKVDLVIGAVLVHGAKAPYVIKREQLKLMKPNAVLVDVAIDQGGCFETSKPTTHADPTFEVDGITHYCVANMPGAVPITSTYALTNATLPYALAIADNGLEKAIERDPGLGLGVNVAAGKVTYPAVAESVDEECTEVSEALSLVKQS